MRPDNATDAASSPSSASTAWPRIAASERATAAVSMEPRTDEPTRTSGWVRVLRTTSTTLASQAWSTSAAGSASPTMAVSSAASW